MAENCSSSHHGPATAGGLPEFPLLAYMGHEHKLIAASVLANITLEDARDFFTKREIEKSIVGFQGEKPAWKPGTAVVGSYLSSSLVPGGLAEKGEALGRAGKSTAGYRATPYGCGSGMAFVGSLMEWSADYPKYSIQTLVGSSRSDSKLKSPVVRFSIYEALAKDESATTQDMLGKLGCSRASLNCFVLSMRNEGILRFPRSSAESKVLAFADEDIAVAARSLVSLLHRTEDRNAGDYYKEIALDIVNNPLALRELGTKGLRFSAHSELRGQEKLDQAIYDVLSSGETSVREIAAQFREKGLPYGHQTVNKRLSELSIKGTVSIGPSRLGSSRRSGAETYVINRQQHPTAE